jgi:hypothetical protein
LWESFGKTLITKWLSSPDASRFFGKYTISGKSSGLRQYPITSPQDAQQKRPGKPIRNFQGLRTMSMTKKRENIGGNPTSGHKNPESQCPVLFTPRK